MPGSPDPPEEDAYDRVIRVLIDARREAGLRQADLAERLGWPQPNLSRYETGERRIDMGQFVAIARALGADPAELLARALAEG